MYDNQTPPISAVALYQVPFQTADKSIDYEVDKLKATILSPGFGPAVQKEEQKGGMRYPLTVAPDVFFDDADGRLRDLRKLLLDIPEVKEVIGKRRLTITAVRGCDYSFLTCTSVLRYELDLTWQKDPALEACKKKILDPTLDISRPIFLCKFNNNKDLIHNSKELEFQLMADPEIKRKMGDRQFFTQMHRQSPSLVLASPGAFDEKYVRPGGSCKLL